MIAVNLSGVDFPIVYKFLNQFSCLAFRKKILRYESLLERFFFNSVL